MKFILIAASLLGAASALIVCPHDYCSKVLCEDVSACGGKVVPNGGFCGCCDSCENQLSEGDNCFGSLLLGVPATTSCGDGLHCDHTTFTCKATKKRAADPGPCTLKHQEYLLGVQNHLLGMTEPDCDVNGDYNPKQCQGSKCFCVSKNGTQIQNYGANVWEAQHMNCQCARDQQEYMATGLIGRLFYCTNNGNYQTYQCQGSVCFCTDDNGNQLGSKSVNIGMLDTLDC